MSGSGEGVSGRDHSWVGKGASMSECVGVWVGGRNCLPKVHTFLSLPPTLVVKLHALASLRFALGRKRMPSSIREKSNPVQWDSVSPLRKSYRLVSTRLDIPTIPYLSVISRSGSAHEKRKKERRNDKRNLFCFFLLTDSTEGGGKAAKLINPHLTLPWVGSERRTLR